MTHNYIIAVLLLLMAFVVLVFLFKKPTSQFRYNNVEDIHLLQGGIMEFTFQGVIYKGTVAEIQYVPVGPGGINVQLISMESEDRRPIPDIPLSFSFSFFMAETESAEGKLSINQLIPQPGFGNLFVIYQKSSAS